MLQEKKNTRIFFLLIQQKKLTWTSLKKNAYEFEYKSYELSYDEYFAYQSLIDSNINYLNDIYI